MLDKIENTPEQVQSQISAMGDSVTLIDQKISGTFNVEDWDTVDRNVRHLEIMLEKEHIIGSGSDLSVFSDIVSRAKDILTANPKQ